MEATWPEIPRAPMSLLLMAEVAESLNSRAIIPTEVSSKSSLSGGLSVLLSAACLLAWPLSSSLEHY